jgi:uncharacterized membrane protein
VGTNRITTPRVSAAKSKAIFLIPFIFDSPAGHCIIRIARCQPAFDTTNAYRIIGKVTKAIQPERKQTILWLATAAILLTLGALALWGAALAREGNVESIFPWQLPKLRRLLAISGVWFILVGTMLLIGYFFRNQSQDSDSPKSIPGFHPAFVVLALLILAHVAAYGWLATQRHDRFNSTGYDLAIKEQVIWNTLHGRFFASSPEVENAFADHFQPAMLALLPIYAVIPSPKLLLWVQVVGLAAGAIPLYRLARRRLNSPWLALATAAAYLLYPAIGFIDRFDFHPEALAIPAFIAAFEAFDRDDLRAASLWLLVPLLSKENLGFSVAAFGLYATLFRRRVRFGLAWIGVGLVVSSATMFWLIPALRQGPSDTLARYGWLGESPGQIALTLLCQPGYVCQTLAEPNRALYVLQLLLPVGFMALLGLPELLLAMPGLAINILAQHHCQAEIYCQYTVPIVPFVFIAAVFGLHRLKSWLGQRWLSHAVGLAIIPLAILALAIDNPFTEGQELPPPLADLPNADAVYRALATVPPKASVVTTNAYAPHLARREGLYIIGIPAQREPPPDPDVVFINLYDQRFMVCEQYRQYFSQLDIDRYGVIFRDWGLIVVQRDGGSNEAFHDFVLNWTDCAG